MIAVQRLVACVCLIFASLTLSSMVSTSANAQVDPCRTGTTGTVHALPSVVRPGDQTKLSWRIAAPIGCEESFRLKSEHFQRALTMSGSVSFSQSSTETFSLEAFLPDPGI